MKITTNFIKHTKRHFSASGSILLPLALKWRLVGVVAICIPPAFGVQSAFAASLTLSTPSTLSVNVTPSTEGTFAKSKSGSISVTSDAYAGYTLTIKGKTDDNALTNGGNSLSSITETAGIDESTFNSAAHNNKWGYKPSRKNSTENSKFFPGPKLAGDILDKTNPSSKQSTTTNYTVELGVRVDNNQPAGIYTGTFVYTATANDLTYSITYDGNGDGATGTPSKQTGSAAEGAGVTISNAPTRDKYVFLGWCSQQTKDETCAGEVYQPNGTYKLINDKNELNLYAMWARIMQNWDGCSALAEATTSGDNQISLIDTRDNKLYYVAKLADGNCWMTENLDLFIDANRTYTVVDTDLDHATEEEKGDSKDADGYYQWKPDKSTYSTATTTWVPTRNNGSTSQFGNGDTIQQSYDPGDFCWNGLIGTSGGGSLEWFNQHSVSCKKHEKVTGSDPHYHLGNYYNYGAAVAQNDTSSKQTDGDSFKTSICPSGWQLPTKEIYQALLDTNNPKPQGGYDGNIHQPPFYYPYIRTWSGVFIDYSYGADYITSTVVDANHIYELAFNGNPSYVIKVKSMDRYCGFPVRCVVRM